MYIYISTEDAISWHVGEPFPTIPKKPVVHFQADGDELVCLVNAIKKASSKEEKV